MNSTSRPVSITSPVISWPRISPAGAVVRPRTMCWSEPQMFVETTFRITPCGHWRPTLAGLTPGRPAARARVVDVLHLDLAGPDVRDASVISHVDSSLPRVNATRCRSSGCLPMTLGRNPQRSLSGVRSVTAVYSSCSESRARRSLHAALELLRALARPARERGGSAPPFGPPACAYAYSQLAMCVFNSRVAASSCSRSCSVM